MILPPQQESTGLLRFLTAGSVDDGKSTLIGRLLHDAGGIFDDEMGSLRCIQNGSQFDPALLTDGLKSEREQGITIDVAYRYFSTARRKFIIADAPGHEQYTRNMITAASTAQAAVLLVDAHKGILPQTRRHTYLAWLLGIQIVIVAVNKMDLVGFDEAVYKALMKDYQSMVGCLGLHDVTFIPISALQGDNVVERSDRTPWYEGLPLLQKLEMVDTYMARGPEKFRFPVQTVLRSNDSFRGYAGQIASGTVHPDDDVLALPSERCLKVDKIFNFTQDLHEAFAPMSVVLSLREDTDLGRGDMLCDPKCPPAKTRRFRATLMWMSNIALQSGQPYLIKHTNQTACMSVVKLFNKIDIGTLQAVAAETLMLNEIGEAEIETHKPIFCDPYAENRTTGSFILIHPISNKTVAAGTVSPAYEQSARTTASSSLSIARTKRGLTVWATGLSGAGKTTICDAVHTELVARGMRVEILDGDAMRQHLSRELGFGKPDRDENIRRIGFVADLLTRNGVIVLVSAISPYRALRDEIRRTIGTFLEVFVNAPLTICEQRDPRGLYKKARAGALRGFTGIDDPYEPPLSPEVECRTDMESVGESVDKVVNAILKMIYGAA